MTYAARCVIPFAVWVAAIFAVRFFSPSAAPWIYAGKSLVCAALLVALRPWKYFEKSAASRTKLILSALILGALVAVVWILPDRFSFYLRWCATPFGSLPDYFCPPTFPLPPPWHPSMAFSPERCGWGLAIAKLLGSAFVISAIEEYFFRGFLYKWLGADRQAFWFVILIFAFEHDRFLVGAFAGLVYGVLALRDRSLLAPIIAHAMTNLLLGIHVLGSGAYGFW